VLDAIERLNRQVRHQTICWTGGEPLLSDRFLRSVLQPLRALGLRNELVTNGTLPEKLAPLLDLFEGITADIKLPCATGEHIDWREVERFLKLAQGRLTAVKMIVVRGTSADEFERALDVAGTAARNAVLVLQPVTPVAAGAEPPDPCELLSMQERAMRTFSRVLVIPQAHKMMGQL
jgi:organic radical activating enzyme